MTHSALRQIRRTGRRDVGTDDLFPFLLTKAASNQKSNKLIGISLGTTPNSEGVFPGDPSQTCFTREEFEQILAREYRSLLTHGHGRLFREYGIREFGVKAPIARCQQPRRSSDRSTGSPSANTLPRSVTGGCRRTASEREIPQRTVTLKQTCLVCHRTRDGEATVGANRERAWEPR